MPAYLLLRVNSDKEMQDKSRTDPSSKQSKLRLGNVQMKISPDKQLVLQLIFESEQDLTGISQLCALSVGFQLKTLGIAS